MFGPLLDVKVSFCVAGARVGRIVSALIKRQRPGRTCWEPNSDLLSTSIGTKMRTCGWRPDLCANGPQSALWARSEPRSYGGKCTAMYCFASSLFTVVPKASFWSNSCQVFFMDYVSIGVSLFLGPSESARPYTCAMVMLHMGSCMQSNVLFVLSHPPKCSQCSCTYVVSFFTCAMLQLHMRAGCVQAHAPKILSWCSATIGEKIRRKTRHSRTYLIHKM